MVPHNLLTRIIMKQHSILRTLITVLLSSFAIELCAQRYWALAVMEQGKEKPTIMEYLGSKEMAENGKSIFGSETLLATTPLTYNTATITDGQTNRLLSTTSTPKKRQSLLTSILLRATVSPHSMVWNGW